MNNMLDECVYRTPCKWCSKWDKKCDKKIGIVLTNVNLSKPSHKYDIDSSTQCLNNESINPYPKYQWVDDKGNINIDVDIVKTNGLNPDWLMWELLHNK